MKPSKPGVLSVWLCLFMLAVCLNAAPVASLGGSDDHSINATPVVGSSPEAISVQYRSAENGSPEVIVISGSSRTLSKRDSVQLYTELPAGRNIPPVFGRVIQSESAIQFQPQYPLQPGLRYFVEVSGELLLDREGKGNVYFAFTIPKPETSPIAFVSAVYPSSGELPENLLKFYLHFSHPMSRGDSYRHIHLLDADGKAVELPFLELGEELWDRDNKRLTLLFDPGRIKSGLKPQREVGSALRQGERYTLQILDMWLDAKGQPLREGFSKPFVVTKPDGESPVPARWSVLEPKPDSFEPLTIMFQESLDEALLQRVIRIIDPDGDLIEGSIQISDSEKRWSFKPEQAWAGGDYRIEIETVLEDLAGNSVGRPFEVAIRKTDDQSRPARYAYLDFTIK